MQPIGVYTIQGGQPTAEQDHTITLSVKLHLAPIKDITLADLERHLQYVLEDWNEGRYPFDVEQLRHGLHASVSRAISNAIAEREQRLHDGEYYTVRNGKTAKWCYTARRAFKRVVWWLNDTLKCTIR